MPKVGVLSSPVRASTPIEVYEGVYVKRDDTCCDDPPLAKIRGLYRFVETRKSFSVFGILDGRHSRNGWALARACKALGKKARVYWPMRVSETPEDRGPTRDAAARLGAETVGIQAGRSAVVFAAARRDLAEAYPNSFMVPNAVKIPETVDAHVAEIASQKEELLGIAPESLVMSCGSGTIAAGVLSGLFRIGLIPEVHIILGYSQEEKRLRRYLGSYTQFPQTAIRILDAGYSYGSKEEIVTDFPCCEYYEAKAWSWLMANRDSLPEPILFWNSGS
jgi:1-aminocyclopropane-1-carboxylate deaminase/D-cysteine desulfhydrase-like pyridoxal-dependent ACC family enzyme